MILPEIHWSLPVCLLLLLGNELIHSVFQVLDLVKEVAVSFPSEDQVPSETAQRWLVREVKKEDQRLSSLLSKDALELLQDGSSFHLGAFLFKGGSGAHLLPGFIRYI